MSDELDEVGGVGAPEQAPGADHGGRLEHPGHPADETPAEAEPSIRATDRVCAIGMTGSGKSILCGHLWAIYPGQRLLVDVNDACELGPASLAEQAGGACEAERVRDIDWRARTIRFVPRAQSEALYNDLYAAIFDRGRMCVWLDESYGPTSAHRQPRWLGAVTRQGRKRELLHLAATQEPVNVMPTLYSQAEHLMVFKLRGRGDELRALAPLMRMTADELSEELARLPEYGFLRSHVASHTVWAKPPLPLSAVEHVRQHVTWA